MSISAVGGQAVQSSQSDTTSLEASKQKIVAEIKNLQKDATKNSKEIQVLQQQSQQIDLQIAQQQAKSQASSTSATTSTSQNVGTAYTVELGNQNVQKSSQNISETSATSSESSPSSEAATSIDLSA